MSKLKAGDSAPDFNLAGPDGDVRLSSYQGDQAVVLYFYPKDNTPVCTREACSFRDAYEDFKAAGAQVIGISTDSASSHERFSRTHHLPFILLSDVEGQVAKQYGVTKTLGLLPGRVTFVIDKSGTIQHVFSSQFSAQKHVDEALKVLRSLN